MLASSKGDLNRAGDLRTKAMKLSAQAEDMRKKLIEEKHHFVSFFYLLYSL